MSKIKTGGLKTSMVLNTAKSNSLEQLALKGLTVATGVGFAMWPWSEAEIRGGACCQCVMVSSFNLMNAIFISA